LINELNAATKGECDIQFDLGVQDEAPKTGGQKGGAQKGGAQNTPKSKRQEKK